jgi:exodeoxyribonuclease VII small subunit
MAGKEKDESFEALYAALEDKARRLEEGGLTLEESVTTYEEGAEIAVKLRELLEKAELRVRELDARLGSDMVELRDEALDYDAEYDLDDDD